MIQPSPKVVVSQAENGWIVQPMIQSPGMGAWVEGQQYVCAALTDVPDLIKLAIVAAKVAQ